MAMSSRLEEHIYSVTPCVKSERKALYDFVNIRRQIKVTVPWKLDEDCLNQGDNKNLQMIIDQEPALRNHFHSHPPSYLCGSDYELVTYHNPENSSTLPVKYGPSGDKLCAVSKVQSQLVSINRIRCQKDFSKESKLGEEALKQLKEILTSFMLQQKAHDLTTNGNCRVPKPIGFLTLRNTKNTIDFMRYVPVTAFCPVLPDVAISLDMEKAIEDSVINFREVKHLLLSILDTLEILDKSKIYMNDLEPRDILIQFSSGGKDIMSKIENFKPATSSTNTDKPVRTKLSKIHPVKDCSVMVKFIMLISKKLQLSDSISDEFKHLIASENNCGYPELKDVLQKCFVENYQEHPAFGSSVEKDCESSPIGIASRNISNVEASEGHSSCCTMS